MFFRPHPDNDDTVYDKVCNNSIRKTLDPYNTILVLCSLVQFEELLTPRTRLQMNVFNIEPGLEEIVSLTEC